MTYNMSVSRSFILAQRIFFVIFSLQFMKDAFFYWDGFSYYMRFRDFLPDLALAFILWSVAGSAVAWVFWVLTYLLPRSIPAITRRIRFEHILVWLVLGVAFYFLAFIKKTFINLPVSDLIGVNRTIVVSAVVMILLAVIWFLRRSGRISFEKILSGLDSRITPVIWLFAVCFIIAIPASAMKKTPTGLPSPKSSNVSADDQNRDRPNIILVTMDALAAKDMQLYGYERPTTPFLSEWAREAFVFNRAYSSSNWTTPGAMSIMTGQRPWTHGIWYDAQFHPRVMDQHSLPSVLKDHGYSTYAFVQNEHAHPETLGIEGAFVKCDRPYAFGTKKGLLVDMVTHFPPKRQIALEWIFRHPVFVPFYFLQPDTKVTSYPAGLVFDRFIDHISQSGREPFFAWLHINPPHDPYLPPGQYAGAFGEAGKFNTERTQKRNFDFHQQYAPEKQADVDILRRRYDEFILYCDEQFRLFLSRLSRTVDLSRTVIILSSDHGESFSHGFLAHNGAFLYDPLVHIPLVIKLPGEKDGKTFDVPVEQTDITSTIFELAGIPPPQWTEGASLLPMITGKTLEHHPVFSMQLQENRAIGGYPITKGSIAVWKNDHKLIYYLGKDARMPELYDLKTDPDETRNIFPADNRTAQQLVDMISENLSRANKRITSLAPQ